LRFFSDQVTASPAKFCQSPASDVPRQLRSQSEDTNVDIQSVIEWHSIGNEIDERQHVFDVGREQTLLTNRRGEVDLPLQGSRRTLDQGHLGFLRWLSWSVG
jgi:hypothetical protein